MDHNISNNNVILRSLYWASIYIGHCLWSHSALGWTRTYPLRHSRWVADRRRNQSLARIAIHHPLVFNPRSVDSTFWFKLREDFHIISRSDWPVFGRLCEICLRAKYCLQKCTTSGFCPPSTWTAKGRGLVRSCCGLRLD